MNDYDVLLTGVPRSGTTLTCELLNQLPDTVALDEPMDVESLIDQWRGRILAGRAGPSERAQHPDPSLICDEIDRSLERLRDSIRDRKSAPSWQVDGRVFAGRIADDPGSERLRTALATRGEVRIEKALSPTFLLVAKHPAVFTALLKTLVQRFRVYAVVRNPLAVLSSWQTVPLDMREGFLPVAERVDLTLAAALARLEDRVDRQFHLLSWLFEKYRDILPGNRVIRYESIVCTKGKALSVITPRASALNEPLESRNRATIYDRTLMRALGERLLDTDGPYWDFYTKESVMELLED